jgi:creatinine amidohydrolase
MNANRAILILIATLTPLAGLRAQTPNTVFIEEMTWTEVRDAMRAGKTAIIVPIGGTEQNGPHILLGKHNRAVTFAADLMARRLGNALVAPTLQYVPEGDYNRPNFGTNPGTLSNPSPSFEAVLDATARSLRAGGFKEILLIGDSGGNQNGVTAVATKLNEEWKGSGFTVYGLTDYYQKGRETLRVWLLDQFGYDDAMVGNHAGIVGTSAMMYLYPSGLRLQKMEEIFGGGRKVAGVTGDPTKSSVEIGRMIIEFKVQAGMAQYQALKRTGLQPTTSAGSR